MQKAGRCKDLGLNLLECIRLLKGNQNLMKLISDTSDSPLSMKKPDLSTEEIDGFMEEFIFPYLFIPEIEQEVKTLLMVGYSRIKIGEHNTGSKRYLLNVRFYCHKQLSLIDGDVRSLAIFHEIDDTLNEATITSLGKLKFVDAIHADTNRTYYGYDMYYEIMDFN